MEDDVRRAFASVDEACRSACGQLRSIAACAEVKYNALDVERHELRKRLDDVTAENDKLKRDVAMLEVAVAQEKTTADHLTRRIHDLEEENKEFKKVSRIIAYERENAELRRRVDALVAKNAPGNTKDRDKLTDAEIQTDAELDQPPTDAASTESDPDVEALKTENADLKAEIRMLTDMLKSVRNGKGNSS